VADFNQDNHNKVRQQFHTRVLIVTWGSVLMRDMTASNRAM